MNKQDIQEHQEREFVYQILEPEELTRIRLEAKEEMLMRELFQLKGRVNSLEETILVAGTVIGLIKREPGTHIQISRDEWENTQKYNCYVLPENLDLTKGLGLIPIRRHRRYRFEWDDEQRVVTHHLIGGNE